MVFAEVWALQIKTFEERWGDRVRHACLPTSSSDADPEYGVLNVAVFEYTTCNTVADMRTLFRVYKSVYCHSMNQAGGTGHGTMDLEFHFMRIDDVCDADRQEIDTVWLEAFGRRGEWEEWSHVGDFNVAFARYASGTKRVVVVCLTQEQECDADAGTSLFVFCFGAHPRKVGYGRRLVDYLKDLCSHSHRISSITLNVDTETSGEDMFYEKQGFCVTEYPGPYDTEFKMRFPTPFVAKHDMSQMRKGPKTSTQRASQDRTMSARAPNPFVV